MTATEHVCHEADQRPALLARAAPLAVGAGLGGAAILLAMNDPSAASSRFPACAFHSMTGLWCPGCGLTRGTHALLNGRIPEALSSNIFTPLAIVAIVLAWLVWLRRSWGRPAWSMPRWGWQLTATVLPIALVGYGVLRNIPAAPFRSLAP